MRVAQVRHANSQWMSRRRACSTFKMLQHVWSLGPGNMSVVCLNWCTMTCTGWLFLGECRTSLLWQSIAVFGTELQGMSPTIACHCLKLLVARTCDLPDGINSQFREFAAASLGPVHFLSPDQESGIHCLIICGIQLLTANNLGETWRRICSPNIRRVRALQVLHNRALQIDIYLLSYLLRLFTIRTASKMFTITGIYSHNCLNTNKIRRRRMTITTTARSSATAEIARDADDVRTMYTVWSQCTSLPSPSRCVWSAVIFHLVFTYLR